jgi:uncharacterized repeat protein (TIGR03803 family)
MEGQAMQREKNSLAVFRGWAAIILLVLAMAATAEAKGKVLYTFQGGNDGKTPTAGLTVDAAGNLYGTTESGGSGDYGTVYELSPPATQGAAWTHTVLYSFSNTGDGAYPGSGVIRDSAGNLYGVATGNGLNAASAAFELSPPAALGDSWTQTTLYTFGQFDFPEGRLLLDKQGNLYGTAFSGGDNGSGYVYQLSPPVTKGGVWTETTLYNFTGGNDGGNPQAGLIFDASGNLYGTATEGGILTDCSNSGMKIGCGVVYELSPNGSGGWIEAVLYAFRGRIDEYSPASELAFDKRGALYGTSVLTVYRLTPPAKPGALWQETTIHSFPGGVAGSNTAGDVVFDKSGNLYGATYSFGLEGYASVYELSPPASKGSAWTLTTLVMNSNGFNSPLFNGSLIFGKNGALYGSASASAAAPNGLVYSFLP